MDELKEAMVWGHWRENVLTRKRVIGIVGQGLGEQMVELAMTDLDGLA